MALNACPGSAWRAWGWFDRAVALASRLEADGITHLHAHFLSGPAVVAYLATRIFPIPYSLSAHAADVWSDPVCPAAIQSAACCVACSQSAADDLSRRYPDARVETIHHGLSRAYLDQAASASGLPSGGGDLAEWRILSAGRLVNKKGFDLLIGACAELRDEGIGVRCRIFGDGPLRQALQSRIDAAGLSSRVTLHPFVGHEELRREFGEAHLFALPCRIDASSGDRDGIPNVLLEAMAAGTVVVSTDLPTIRELIVPDATGFLAPADDAAGLARAIRSALSTRAEWPRIRQEARETLRRRFCLEDNQDRFRLIIEDAFRDAPIVPR
jgi:glycosyltransferase involved in cell wall biosynthesis